MVGHDGLLSGKSVGGASLYQKIPSCPSMICHVVHFEVEFTSVNPKRRRELKELFSRSRAGLVFVTAFLDRRAMLKYLNDISWETEVWIADSPTHLIHFNGERFLGPYEE